MDNGSYSLGWIAPLPLELTAALASLDERYSDAHVDGYIFHRGRIGQHKIVLGVQPRMGTDAASDLAARMRAAFQHIEYFLVVGIGGGVPTYGRSSAQSQVVLGDVIVSYPKGHYGGVVRYDFGAWADDGRLEFKGHTNGPPGPLLNAVNALQARHALSGSQIPLLLQEMRLRLHQDLRRKFEDQGGENDKLFDNNYRHSDPSRQKDCQECCDQTRAQKRHLRGTGALRERDRPVIHYGNIASSNQLQISASKRDRVQEDLDVICFEMEGAGVIQMHPALIIRGVCDYSDSHKNKKWQPYAAATAATYAKELLQILPARQFEQTSPFMELSNGFGEMTTDGSSTSWVSMSKCQPDFSWFYKAFDTELQEVSDDMCGCKCSNHTDDEFLMGFANSSVFQSWLSQGGSSLWCRLEPDEVSHRATGACLIRQAIIPLSFPVYILGYRCRESPHLVLPRQYRKLKEELAAERNKKADGKESHARQDLIEAIMLSFLMQVVHCGLRVELGSLDFSHPQLFLSSLVTALIEALNSQSRRIIIVVDQLEGAREQELAALVATLASILTHDRSNQCSVLIASNISPAVSLVLKGTPMVYSSSEYRECLYSLHLKDRNVRRSEIAEAVKQSNSWIWSHPAFENLMTQNSAALAIEGKAGSGKSVLAKTIQQGILSQPSSGQDIIAADWFYCRRKGSPFTIYSSLLTSILYEILAKAKLLAFDNYKPVYRRQAPGHTRIWTTLELEEVLKGLAGSSVPLFLVFDAIDEANDLYTIPLVESLVSEPCSRIKIVVLSRPMPQLHTSFWSSRRIVLQYENSGDVQAVIDDGLLNLHRIMLGDHDNTDPAPSPGFQTHAFLRMRPTRESENPFSPTGRDQVAAKDRLSALGTSLRERCDGVILWLVLIFESLSKVVKSEVSITVDELKSYISEYPQDIEPVYTHMVEDLSSRMSTNGLKKARTALMWINVATQTKPFSLSELWDALAIPETLLGEEDAHSIISRREVIRNWQDFHRKIQLMCGSFIEVLPDQGNPGAEASGSLDISGNSVVQLMHQTAKDYLTTSPGAGALAFTEEDAFDLVSSRTLRYMDLVFPPEHGGSKPSGITSDSGWLDYMSSIAFSLEEFRLIEFCCRFGAALPTPTNNLQSQSRMVWNGFVDEKTFYQNENDSASAFEGWRYDIISRAYDERVPSALGYIFHFATTLGLTSAIRNILSLSKLDYEMAFWDIYGDAILNGVLFTVLDQRDHPQYGQIRAKLTHDVPQARRQSATLALDHLYDMNRTSTILALYAPHLSIDIHHVYDAVERVLKHVYGWSPMRRETIPKEYQEAYSPPIFAQATSTITPPENPSNSPPLFPVVDWEIDWKTLQSLNTADFGLFGEKDAAP